MQTLKEIMVEKISTALGENKMRFKDSVVKEVLDSTDFPKAEIEKTYHEVYENFVEAYYT
jgi:hypothetical protein